MVTTKNLILKEQISLNAQSRVGWDGCTTPVREAKHVSLISPSNASYKMN